MQLQWRRSLDMSCFHAAYQVREGFTLASASLQAALSEAVANLDSAIAEERLSADLFWRHLVPLAGEFAVPRQLAEVVLTKLQGRSEAQMRIPRFERHIYVIKSAFAQNTPKPADASTCLDSLQQRWNYQGPGLLAGVANWTDEMILVEQASVWALHAYAGGGGFSHLPYNSVRIETVDDVGELPEFIRLAWLLAQLNVDMPRFGEHVPVERLDRVARLAMIPAVLTAGEPMKLTSCSQEAVAAAMHAWLAPSEHGHTQTAMILHWWDVYKTKRPTWSSALQALDRLLTA